MSGTVRARYKAGVLELLEDVDISEGEEVSVTILKTPSTRSKNGLHRSAGGWKGLVDADTLIENIYNDRMISTRPL